MTRRTLPTRRPSITVPAAWNNQCFTVSIGFDPATGTPLEVFAGEAKGDMLALVSDACVALSIAMQHGATPAALLRSMGRAPVWAIVDGEMVETTAPASPIGAILDAITSQTQEPAHG